MIHRPKFTRTALIGLSGLVALSGCARDNEIVATSGVGISVSRSACPAVGVPAYTGDVTLFNPQNSRDASAIDVVAQITNLRSQCDDTGPQFINRATFDVTARRSNAQGARDVVLPYFATVVQGGSNVVSKQVSRVSLHFNDGEYRASTSGQAVSYVDKSVATLPAEIQEKIARRRKPGEADAAVDPLSEPDVKEAVQRTRYELLVGFNLSQDQLQYNATR